MKRRGIQHCVQFLLIFFILINGLSYAQTVGTPSGNSSGNPSINTPAPVVPLEHNPTPPSNTPTPVVPESKPLTPPSTPPTPVVPEEPKPAVSSTPPAPVVPESKPTTPPSTPPTPVVPEESKPYVPSTAPTPVVPEEHNPTPPSNPPTPVVPDAKLNSVPARGAPSQAASTRGAPSRAAISREAVSNSNSSNTSNVRVRTVNVEPHPRTVLQAERAPAVIETEPGVIAMPQPTRPAIVERVYDRRRGMGMRSRRFGPPIVKIEPHIRSFELDLDPYPMDIIRTFMLDGLIVQYQEDLEGTAYLVGLENQHAVVGEGYYIYARGLCDVEQKHYAILGRGKKYFHPVTKECLGYHAPIIGKAELTILGPVSQLRVIDAVEIVERKNLLIPTYLLPPIPEFKAKPGTTPIEGMILDVKEDWIGIGKNNTVILSIGEREGLQEGDYLDIYNVTARGAICIGCPPKLPDLKIGRVVAFRVYEKMSLALVVEATEEINLLDRVRAPMDCNPRPGIGVFEPPSYSSPGIGVFQPPNSGIGLFAPPNYSGP